MRKALLMIVALILSGLLIVSIPALNLWVRGDWNRRNKPSKTAVQLVRSKLEKPPEEKPKTKKRPKRSKRQNRNVKSGPRFAMDLGVAGPGGVSLPSDLVNTQRGNGGFQGDVDERPNLNGGLDFKLPEGIREQEMDAVVVLSFCVNARGEVYNIRILEERPAGMGLGQAGRQALSQSNFSPAMLGGQPVDFCGVEQPIEVRYKD